VRPVSAPVLNRLERAMLAVAPNWMAKRASARLRVQAMQSAYDAIGPSRLRRGRRDMGSGNTIADYAQRPLRDIARDLDRNHDLARGTLNVMVRNIVGATGIGVEPQPLGADGTVDAALAKQMADLWGRWSRYPEVTAELNWARSEQLLCRSWLRDGECLWQYLDGNVPKLTHASGLPYSLELLECDLLPVDYSDPLQNISQGIELDSWGRPKGYWVYKQHPGDPFVGMPSMKRVPSERIGHLKLVDRIGQRRGVSLFAAVLNRLDDLKDYEESERIAAKIAASLAAVIKKGAPDDYSSTEGAPNPARNMAFQPGMVLDALNPGEDVSIIDSKRPNPNALLWRNGQLRAIAAGTDASYSSISRNYEGSYSAQRQELVETFQAYSLLSYAFIDQCTSEVYRRFVAAMVLAGQVKPARGVSFDQLCQCIYIPPSMPWIDPAKEADAYATLEDRAYISGPEIIRKQGRNPQDVLRAQKQWLADKAAAGIPPAPSGSASPAPVDEPAAPAPTQEAA
jgi:lambda family phage portal protein